MPGGTVRPGAEGILSPINSAKASMLAPNVIQPLERSGASSHRLATSARVRSMTPVQAAPWTGSQQQCHQERRDQCDGRFRVVGAMGIKPFSSQI
jgi:hypothetical protein